MRVSFDGVGRRAFLSVWAAATVVVPPVRHATAAGGPSSLSGKPRPETGVVLLEPVEQTGSTISAELLIDSASQAGGISAVAVFESAYPLAKGNYYDAESRNKEGDAAFIHIAVLPAGQQLETVPNSFFTDTALGSTGRFGSYSAPQITAVSTGKSYRPADSSGKVVVPSRFVEVSFNALTQSGFEVPRRGVIAALQPPGSSDVLLLVSSVGAAKWKKGGDADVRLAAESFRVTRSRPSSLQRRNDNDYRYSSRSLKGFSEGESEIEAALARDLSTQSGALDGKFADAARGSAGGAGRSGVAGYAPNF